jgi:hypothetical protein
MKKRFLFVQRGEKEIGMKTKELLDRYGAGERDFHKADLIGANLTGAKLSEADLSNANLTWAKLTEAKLTEARGSFAVGSFGKHRAIAAGGYISIGCERHSFEYWLANADFLGVANGYNEGEIAIYRQWIEMVVEWLSE